MEYPSVAITSRFTVTWSGCIYQSETDFFLKLIILDRNAWNHITVCLLFVSDRNTWKHITVCKQNRNNYLKLYIYIYIDRNIWKSYNCVQTNYYYLFNYYYWYKHSGFPFGELWAELPRITWPWVVWHFEKLVQLFFFFWQQTSVEENLSILRIHFAWTFSLHQKKCKFYPLLSALLVLWNCFWTFFFIVWDTLSCFVIVCNICA